MGEKNPPGFFTELKRRSVYKVAVAYAVVAWLLIQIATQVFPFLQIPDWAIRLVILLLALGFPIALILAWAFELTPEGLKRSDDAAALPPRKHNHAWIYVVIVGAFLSLGLFFAGRLTAPDKSGGSRRTPERSIAVLPFENLSKDPENAYFADGIQDEILTRLAKIGDLKVISRTSTHRYKSSPDDLPKIAQQLGVAHVLEGSVQKSGGQVRVTVQLIRAASDSHLWAETYDRNLTDIFAVESEVAEKIARSLQVQLTGDEKEAVAARPTENTEAYEAYLRGLALWNSLTTSPQIMEKNVLYLDRAVQLDPNFGLAWASLSAAHTFIYAEYDRTPARLALAKRALDTALRLDPDSGETQFALGMFRYRGLADYDGALSAFQKARQRAANRVEAIEFSAYVKRRQGKWDEAIALHRESLQLDPRNPILLSEAALTYRAMRRLQEARDLINRALELEPTSLNLVVQKAETYLAEGNLAAASQVLSRLPLDGQDAAIFGARIRQWMLERKFDEAIEALRKVLAAPENLPKSFVPSYRVWLGMVELLAGQADAGRADIDRGHQELLQLRMDGNKGPRIMRDLILAAGFRHDKAAVDRHAAEVQKEIENDALDGPGYEEALAIARAHLGETDAALASVGHLLKTYGETSLTSALLRLDPLWDPLRSDPRFKKLSQP